MKRKFSPATTVTYPIRINTRNAEIEDLKFKLNQSEREKKEQEMLLADMAETKRMNENYKNEINNCEQRRIELQVKFERALDDHKKQMQTEFETRQKILAEKAEIANQLRVAERKISDLENQLQKSQLECDKRGIEIENLKNRLEILDDTKNQRDSLLSELKKY
jgi:septal ring factor EnvC (AmiA/AmiB activator)